MEVYGHILDEDRRKNAVVRLRCGWSGCRAADEGAGKSGDGSFA